MNKIKSIFILVVALVLVMFTFPSLTKAGDPTPPLADNSYQAPYPQKHEGIVKRIWDSKGTVVATGMGMIAGFGVGAAIDNSSRVWAGKLLGPIIGGIVSTSIYKLFRKSDSPTPPLERDPPCSESSPKFFGKMKKIKN